MHGMNGLTVARDDPWRGLLVTLRAPGRGAERGRGDGHANADRPAFSQVKGHSAVRPRAKRTDRRGSRQLVLSEADPTGRWASRVRP